MILYGTMCLLIILVIVFIKKQGRYITPDDPENLQEYLDIKQEVLRSTINNDKSKVL